MQYCVYLSWQGLTPNEWAAWVQAVGSVVAILAAAWLPIWHRRLELARELNTYVEMLSVAQSYAAEDAREVQKWVGNLAFDWGNAHWDAIISALKGVEYHQLPDFRLFVPLQDALRHAQECKCVLGEAISDAHENRPISVALSNQIRASARRLENSYTQAAAVANSYGGRTPIQIARWYWQKIKEATMSRRQRGQSQSPLGSPRAPL